MKKQAGRVIIIATVLALAGSILAEDVRVERFNASLSYESSGDYASALAELTGLDETTANDYLIQLRLGWLYYLNSRYPESQFAYSRAVSLSADKSVEALLGLTLPLAAQDKWSEVERTYRKILTLDKSQYDANLRLGQIYLNRGEYALAEPLLRGVHRNYPGAYEPNLFLGWTAYYLGKRDEARLCFTRALMLSPGDTSATRGLGLTK